MTGIERDRVRELLGQGAQLVEALPEDEFAYEHWPGAINISLKTLDAASTTALHRDRPVERYGSVTTRDG
jgi:rhodanese-related sulfurtransferase